MIIFKQSFGYSYLGGSPLLEYCNICGAKAAKSIEENYFCEECFDKYTDICHFCSERVITEDAVIVGSNLICQDCLEEETAVCENCNSLVMKQDAEYFEHTNLCFDCYAEVVARCDHCNTEIWSKDSVQENDIVICGICYEEDYVRCNNCHELFLADETTFVEEDDAYYCDNCFDRQNDSNIYALHSYSYKPLPVFFGTGRYFGIELEVDNGNDKGDAIESVLDIANAMEDYIYI